jgi:FtsH-binding integral membrane protein
LSPWPALTCFRSLRITAPLNYVLLFGFTLFLSFFTGVIVARYDTLTVLIAVAGGEAAQLLNPVESS